MGGLRSDQGMSGRQLEVAYREELGTHGAEVAQLMAAKQAQMIEWEWCSEGNFRHLNKWHLMSAELVIADLLEKK